MLPLTEDAVADFYLKNHNSFGRTTFQTVLATMRSGAWGALLADPLRKIYDFLAQYIGLPKRPARKGDCVAVLSGTIHMITISPSETDAALRVQSALRTDASTAGFLAHATAAGVPLMGQIPQTLRPASLAVPTLPPSLSPHQWASFAPSAAFQRDGPAAGSGKTPPYPVLGKTAAVDPLLWLKDQRLMDRLDPSEQTERVLFFLPCARNDPLRSLSFNFTFVLSATEQERLKRGELKLVLTAHNARFDISDWREISAVLLNGENIRSHIELYFFTRMFSNVKVFTQLHASALAPNLELPACSPFLGEGKQNVLTIVRHGQPPHTVLSPTVFLNDHAPAFSSFFLLARLVSPVSEEQLLGSLPHIPEASKSGNSGAGSNSSTSKTPDEDDIIEVSHKLRLTCPISFGRIKVPAKGRFCTHRECFDLMTYLGQASISKLLNCPLCRKFLPFRDLRIDDWVSGILSQFPQEESVVVMPDGTVEMETGDAEGAELSPLQKRPRTAAADSSQSATRTALNTESSRSASMSSSSAETTVAPSASEIVFLD